MLRATYVGHILCNENRLASFYRYKAKRGSRIRTSHRYRTEEIDVPSVSCGTFRQQLCPSSSREPHPNTTHPETNLVVSARFTPATTPPLRIRRIRIRFPFRKRRHLVGSSLPPLARTTLATRTMSGYRLLSFLDAGTHVERSAVAAGPCTDIAPAPSK